VVVDSVAVSAASDAASAGAAVFEASAGASCAIALAMGPASRTASPNVTSHAEKRGHPFAARERQLPVVLMISFLSALPRRRLALVGRISGRVQVYLDFMPAGDPAELSSSVTTRAIAEVLIRSLVPVDSSTRMVTRSASRCTFVTTP
jgi:hypothetical protein